MRRLASFVNEYSVHFQEMPGFKGKRKGGLTLTLYKKTFERDFFNKLGVLIDGDFKFGVLLFVFVRFLGGDTGNLSSHEKHDQNCDTLTFLSCS
jgi:hypothetical protein